MTEDRKRLVLLLSVVALLILIGSVGFVLTSSGGSTTSTTVSQRPVTIETPEPAEQPIALADQEKAVVPLPPAGARDPFEPLVDPTPAATTQTNSTDAKKKPSTPGKKPASKPVNSAPAKPTRRPDEPKAPAKPAADKRKPTDSSDDAPRLIVDDDGTRVVVKLVEVRKNRAVARINGKRSYLFVGVPGDQHVTYVSSLGGGCIWLGRQGVEERIAICEGDTETI